MHINPGPLWPLSHTCQFCTCVLILKTRGLSGEAITNREIFRFDEPVIKSISEARLVARISTVTRFICRRAYSSTHVASAGNCSVADTHARPPTPSHPLTPITHVTSEASSGNCSVVNTHISHSHSLSLPLTACRSLPLPLTRSHYITHVTIEAGVGNSSVADAHASPVGRIAYTMVWAPMCCSFVQCVAVCCSVFAVCCIIG